MTLGHEPCDLDALAPLPAVNHHEWQRAWPWHDTQLQADVLSAPEPGALLAGSWSGLVHLLIGVAPSSRHHDATPIAMLIHQLPWMSLLRRSRLEPALSAPHPKHDSEKIKHAQARRACGHRPLHSNNLLKEDTLIQSCCCCPALSQCIPKTHDGINRQSRELSHCTERECLRGLHERDVVSLKQDPSCNTVVCWTWSYSKRVTV